MTPTLFAELFIGTYSCSPVATAAVVFVATAVVVVAGLLVAAAAAACAVFCGNKLG